MLRSVPRILDRRIATMASPLYKTQLLQALLEEQAPQEAAVEELPSGRSKGEEAEGDIKVIQGKDELVLQCGKASITLRRNGKIILKGTYIETHSEGVNRIKGCSIQFN
jgi:hypothetical protein